MNSDFSKRLQDIREAKKRQPAPKQPSAKNLKDLIRETNLTEKCFAYREQVQKIIEECIDRFLGEAPSFTKSKGFYEGKYCISIMADELLVDRHGEMDKHFSRISFLLDPCGEEETFMVQCKKTVRQRDLETSRFSQSFLITDMKEVRQFVEGQFFEFAESYFTPSGLSPVEMPAVMPEEPPVETA
ncbi:MAG: hypothetical protein U1E76_10960 [Planctomycetota bacterium]